MRICTVLLIALVSASAFGKPPRGKSSCAGGNCGLPIVPMNYQLAAVPFETVAAPPPPPAPVPATVLPAPIPPGSLANIPTRSGVVVIDGPLAAPQTEVDIKEKRNKTVVKIRTTTAALDQLNFQRAQRGLRPYLFDEGLTRAAERCATIKAQSCLSGHLPGGMSDFSCLDPGVHAASAGADGSKISASDPNFYTCAMYDNYTYAGAAQFVGPDGCKYMSLFVR